MQVDKRPLYLMVAEALKHLKNHNYGMTKQSLLDLWERLANEYDPDYFEDRDKTKPQE